MVLLRCVHHIVSGFHFVVAVKDPYAVLVCKSFVESETVSGVGFESSSSVGRNFYSLTG